MTKTVGFALALSTLLALGACNTVEGAGKDLNSAGKAVSKASGQDK